MTLVQRARSFEHNAAGIARRPIAADWYSANCPVMDELRASSAFTGAEYQAFPWQHRLDPATYCKLVSTYSTPAMLEPARRNGLLQGIASVIRNHGGVLTLHYQTGLFLARRI
jgi:hypothetical protein